MKFSAVFSIAGLIVIATSTAIGAEEVATSGAELLRLPEENSETPVEQDAGRLQEIENQINGGTSPTSTSENRIRPIGEVEGLDIPDDAVFIDGANGDALGIEIR
ncbi:MAG: hypothetical protein ACTS2F_28600 [Thainema sp.]